MREGEEKRKRERVVSAETGRERGSLRVFHKVIFIILFLNGECGKNKIVHLVALLSQSTNHFSFSQGLKKNYGTVNYSMRFYENKRAFLKKKL